MVVTPQHKVQPCHLSCKPLILPLAHVGQSDHCFALLLLPQVTDSLDGSLHWVSVDKSFSPGCHLLPHPVPDESHQTDPVPVGLNDKVWDDPRRRQASLLLDKIGEHPREGTPSHLLLKILKAKVKLMITRDSSAHSQLVEGVQHVAALGRLALQAWREGIPGEEDEGIRMSIGLEEGLESCCSPNWFPPTSRGQVVDVSEVKKGNLVFHFMEFIQPQGLSP